MGCNLLILVFVYWAHRLFGGWGTVVVILLFMGLAYLNVRDKLSMAFQYGRCLAWEKDQKMRVQEQDNNAKDL